MLKQHLLFNRVTSLLFLLLIAGWFTACQTDTNKTPTIPETDQAALYQQRLHPKVAAITQEIKEEFDAGLRNYIGEERSLSYLYEQNARILRMHFLAEETFRHVFPFNGKINEEQLSNVADQLPYFTKKCGFQSEEGIVNYYCPAIDSAFFSYLADIKPASRIIQKFHDSYLETKVITPDVRQGRLLQALEALDFNSPDHQLFYALFQLWIHEEMRAYAKVSNK